MLRGKEQRWEGARIHARNAMKKMSVSPRPEGERFLKRSPSGRGETGSVLPCRGRRSSARATQRLVNPLDQLFHLERFGDKRVPADRSALRAHFLLQHGGGEEDDGNRFQVRVILQLRQHVAAV